MTVEYLTDRVMDLQIMTLRITDPEVDMDERLTLIRKIPSLLIPTSEKEGVAIRFTGYVPAEADILAIRILGRMALVGESDEIRIAAIQAMMESDTLLAYNIAILIMLRHDEQVGDVVEDALATLVGSDWKAGGLFFEGVQQLASAACNT